MVYMVTLVIPDDMHIGTLDVVVTNPLDDNAGPLYEDKADATHVMEYMQSMYPEETYKILELEITPATPSPVL